MDANPYASLPQSKLEISTPEDPARAGRLRRLAATTLDLVLVCGACFTALVMIFLVEDLAGLKLNPIFDQIAAIAMLAVTAALHLPLLFSGQTIGKKIFGLRIVRENGETAAPARVLIRQGPPLLALFILLAFLALSDYLNNPMVGLFLLLPFAVPLGWLFILRADRRTLYDLMAGTMVVRA